MHTELNIIREFTVDVEAVGVEEVKEDWYDLWVTYGKALTFVNYHDYGISTGDTLKSLNRPIYCRDCGIKMRHESELCSFAGGFTCFVCYEQFIRDVDGDEKADELVERWNKENSDNAPPQHP